MSEAATLPASSTPVDRSFLWRRLHSLSGVVPVGGFLVYHLYENMAALSGPQAYDEMVNHVNTMLPRMYFFGVELAGVIVPLLFHSLYGMYIAATGQPNHGRYAYASNWAYWAQRVSGYVAAIYVLVHVGVLRYWITLMGNHLAPGQPTAEGQLDLVTYADVAAHLGNTHHLVRETALGGTHIFALYLVGTLATIYHFTNGLNGFAWTWGLAVGRVAQRRVRAFAWVLFVAMAAATLNILFTMRFGAA
jgi:succinate dehydrogenase/fumarate reductase cytochrome b subunit (b558 family)